MQLRRQTQHNPINTKCQRESKLKHLLGKQNCVLWISSPHCFCKELLSSNNICYRCREWFYSALSLVSHHLVELHKDATKKVDPWASDLGV